jgi:murein DD-endopeptidase MepM/ murein hydrolase activator NlpD
MRRFAILAILIPVLSAACSQPLAESQIVPVENTTPFPLAEKFAYPISSSESVTEIKDKDGWYNALNFGEENHLGEDWNKNSGGNTDCGEPVFATANGRIVFAGDAGPGWGNVVIIDHRLSSGDLVESLYGHLKDITRTEGEVAKREKIGTVGDGNGRYLCHLHFEIRTENASAWNTAGPGYSPDHTGWVDPSEFIDLRR